MEEKKQERVAIFIDGSNLYHSAKALNIADRVGSIEVGKQADFVLWEIDTPAELSYRIGGNACRKVIKKGKVVLDKDG